MNKTNSFVTAVIAAAGSSVRMGGHNKLLLNLHGIPVLIWSMMAFDRFSQVNEIVVVCREDLKSVYSKLVSNFKFTKVIRIISGGHTRAESVYNGIRASNIKTRYILVHDADRPLISKDVIERVLIGTIEHNAAGAALPVTDTIRMVCSDKTITIPRKGLYAMQTPQGGDKSLLAAALKKALDDGNEVTDEVAALEYLGAKPILVEGAIENIKITTPIDLKVAEALLDT